MSYKRDPTLEIVDSITDKINASIEQLIEDKDKKDTSYDAFVEVISRGDSTLLKDETIWQSYISELESGPARKDMFKAVNFVFRDTLTIKGKGKKELSRIPEHIRRLSKWFDMFLSAIEEASPHEINPEAIRHNEAMIKGTRKHLLRLFNKLYAVDSNRLEEIIIEHEKALNDFVFKLTAFIAKAQRDEEDYQKAKEAPH